MNELVMFLKDWIIPLGATGISIWFAASAKKESDRAKEILNDLKAEIQGPHRRVFESSAAILDSLPQVISGKIELAKMQAIEDASKAIRENISNPNNLPYEEHDRNMVALGAHLSMLLEKGK
jgi:hypothetical protein